MKKVYLLLMILGVWAFSTTPLFAADNPVILGNVSPSQLRIQVNSSGTYCIYRWINDAWRSQFYAPNSHLFAIKIGNTTFSSGGMFMPDAGSTMSGVNIAAFSLIEDVDARISTGTEQEMSKRFTGIYNGQQFSVTIKIIYNTSSPDYLIKQATIDATNIPAGTPITLAYGWDTYVNLSDAGFAYILPDIFNLNNNPVVIERYLTTSQVQSLRMVGARNNTGSGALIAFFPIGRDFDRAYSANPYNPGYCFNIPTLTPGNGTSSGTNSQYRFEFGPYSTGYDNGTGVGYDNIPAGQVTEIRTGLTFSSTLDGELDYFWNGQKNYTANVGDDVNLNLEYRSYSPTLLTNVGFRVDHTGLQITAPGCTSSGFTGGTSFCNIGNEFYSLSGAEIVAEGSATVLVPVHITRAGQWIIDGGSITNMTQTLPLGEPAVLTVATTVSLSQNAAAFICRGASQQFTVKFPDTVVANNDVTVNLSYTGATDALLSMPATVTIPAGQNSATFTVTASSTTSTDATVTIGLTETNQVFATVDTPSSVQLTVMAPPTVGGITVPAAVCVGANLTLPSVPVVNDNGSVITSQDWEVLRNGTWVAFSNPVQLGDTQLRYFAENICSRTNSNAVTLTISSVPTVGSITAPAAVCADENLILPGVPTINNNGSTIIAQNWEVLRNGSWVVFSNPVRAGDTELRYFAENTCGRTESNIVSITMHSVPTVGAITAPAAVCAGENLTLPEVPTIHNNGTAIIEQNWEIFRNDSWVAFSNPVQQGDTELRYFAENTCGRTESNIVSITIHSVLTVGAITSPVMACFDTDLTLPAVPTINNDGTIITEQNWEVLRNGSWVVFSNPVQAGDTALRYFAESTCGRTESNVASIIMQSVPTVGLIPETLLVCEGETIPPITLMVEDGNANITREMWLLDEKPFDPNTSVFYESNNLPLKYIAENSCGVSSSNELVLSVVRRPDLNTSRYEVCFGSGIELQAPESDRYLWLPIMSTKQNPVVYPSESTVYILRLTNDVCSFEYPVSVNVLPLPEEVEISQTRLSQIMIFAQNNYKYQLNDEAPTLQSVFNSVPTGNHTLTITDSNGCSIQQSFFTKGLVIPPFFTPNGDGVNDRWEIDLSEFPETKIYIHNRDGKLLEILDINSHFWDGTYRGRDVPSTDYWYIIKIAEFRETQSGHFTLKR